MNTFSISKLPNISDFDNIDSRIKPYLTGWKLKSIYEGDDVDIPGHSNSSFDPIKYFQVIKKPGDIGYREDQRDDEIGLTLWAHWPGYDHECEVNLFIRGPDVTDTSQDKVSAEILKCGGASMKLYWNDKLVTDFTTGWWKTTKDKIWIDEMSKI